MGGKDEEYVYWDIRMKVIDLVVVERVECKYYVVYEDEDIDEWLL